MNISDFPSICNFDLAISNVPEIIIELPDGWHQLVREFGEEPQTCQLFCDFIKQL